MITPRVVTCILALQLTGCGSKREPGPAPTTEPTAVQQCHKPPSETCPKYSCGGNSPIVNTFPINGLRPDGECNPEGVQLVPKSMTGGVDNACNGSTLDVVGNELVGMGKDGVVCDSTKIAGASFVVRSWVTSSGSGGGLRTLTIKIDKVVPYTASNGEARTAYGMSSDGKSLCNAEASAAAREALGIGIIEGLTTPSDDKQLVIPVVSELYDIFGHPIPPERSTWQNRGPEWLSLACVDDALAKRSLYDLYTDNVKNSRAALNMLMASYCYDRHVTMRGIEIGWELVDDAAPEPRVQTMSANKRDPSSLEAKWNDVGAVCLSPPRLLFAGIEIPGGLPDELKKICPTCKTPEEWADKVRECTPLDAAVDLKEKALAPHKQHPPLQTCEACTSDACKGRLFHSYVIKKTP